MRLECRRSGERACIVGHWLDNDEDDDGDDNDDDDEKEHVGVPRASERLV